MGEAAFKVQDSVSKRRGSAFRKYQEMVIGKTDLWTLIKYEFVVLFFSRLPGALGLFLRSKTYPWLLGKVGRGVVFGVGVTLRHPHKIELGDGALIDDNVMLDAKGETNTGIRIGDECFVGRNSILSCKNGDIVLGNRANVGFNCEVFSSSLVDVGEDVLLSAYTYVVGGGNYDIDQLSVPINQSVREDRARGIRIGSDVWIGTHSVLLDGVTIGRGATTAAGSIVNADIPEMSVAAGLPARVLRQRREASDTEAATSEPGGGT